MRVATKHNKISKKTVGHVAERVYDLYMEATKHGFPLEPESFFEGWMDDNASWVSEEFYEAVFRMFLAYLKLCERSV
jgi:hypothetical protein